MRCSVTSPSATALLAIAVVAVSGVAGAADDTRRLRAMQAQLDRLEQALAASGERVATTERQLRALAQRIVAKQTELRARADALRAQRARDRQIRQQLDTHTAAVERAVTALRDPLRQLFAHRRQPWIKRLLNRDRAHAMDRVAGYLEYVHRDRLSDLNAAFDQLQGLRALHRRVTQTGARLSALQGIDRAGLERMATDQRIGQVLLAHWRVDDAQRHTRRRQLQADVRRLQDLLNELNPNLADIPHDAGQPLLIDQVRGTLPWPVKGRLATRFGSRRQFGDLRWEGVMIHTAVGSRVTAIARGRVVYAAGLPGYGLLIVLDHGQQVLSLYGHNQSLFHAVGDWVDAGEVIASVGYSGGFEQPALYFGIRLNDRPVDPLNWCRQARDHWVG